MGSVLENGSRVAVIGGGPAGSLSAYFLLSFARRMGLDLWVDIYEPRDFSKPGPAGCNMCGGIISESLVQALAVEGIELPPTIVQRGGGPRDAREVKWGGLDGYLLDLARNLGARVVASRVSDLDWQDGRPWVRSQNMAETYDFVVGATGVNSTGLQLFEKLGL